MAFSQSQLAAWLNRFDADHYSYQDSYPDEQDATQTGQTTILTELQAYALLITEVAAGVPGTVYYPFGYNARNSTLTGNINRWPNLGDYGYPTQKLVPRGQCYARSVMIYVTEDTWIRFITLNPLYPILINQLYSVDLIASWGISSTIIGVEHFIAADDKDTFSPTYGVAIAYRADTVAGTIAISIEGNVEGGE